MNHPNIRLHSGNEKQQEVLLYAMASRPWWRETKVLVNGEFSWFLGEIASLWTGIDKWEKGNIELAFARTQGNSGYSKMKYLEGLCGIGMRGMTSTKHSLLNYLKVCWVKGQLVRIKKASANTVREHWGHSGVRCWRWSQQRLKRALTETFDLLSEMVLWRMPGYRHQMSSAMICCHGWYWHSNKWF